MRSSLNVYVTQESQSKQMERKVDHLLNKPQLNRRQSFEYLQVILTEAS